MTEVVPCKCWVGGTADLVDTPGLITAGVRAVVDLAIEERRTLVPYDLVYCRFPINDGEGNSQSILQLAIQTVVQLLEKEIPTLVCRSAGMCRSPTIAAFSLAEVSGESPELVLQRFAKLRRLDIKPSFWSEVSVAVTS